MTRRRELEQRRHTLGEIRSIMNSMKTLAYTESRKLGRFIDAQRAVVAHIETMAADFLGFYPRALPRSGQATPVCLLLGSERGFCGDFNETLLRRLESHVREYRLDTPRLIVTGLHEMMYVSLMAENLRRVRHLEGAVQHLDDKSANLLHQSNALRQEEIIEEIEVILLSAASLDKKSPKRQS
ncbi:MAG: F0F1 ATP synthase subunit gamma [Pseudomonadota bacterium]